MYNVLIKIDGIEKRKRSAALLHVIIGFILITKAADYYRIINYKSFIPVFPIYIVAVFSLLYGFIRKRIDFTAKYNMQVRLLQGITFLVLGILVIGQGRSIDYISSFLWAALCLLLLFSERRIYSDTNMLIDTGGITIPGYYTNHIIPWDKLSDVIVRQDYITLFHQNNKYLQYQVLQSLSDLEIAQIAGFCKEQLEKTEADNIKIHLN